MFYTKAHRVEHIQAELGFYSNIFNRLLKAFLYCSGPSLCLSGLNFYLSGHIRYRHFPHLPHARFSLNEEYTVMCLLSV